MILLNYDTIVHNSINLYEKLVLFSQISDILINISDFRANMN